MSTYFKTFAGHQLYESESMIIQQNFNYRWLMFQNDPCIQTLIHRRHPQRASMDYLTPFTWALRSQPGSTCLMGLGGGAVLHLIAPILGTFTMTAVEASAEVITLGRQYFGLDSLQSLTIVHQPAQTFIANTQHSYQHILIDLYASNGFPEPCAKLQFFYHCKQRLAPQGFLAINLVGVSDQLSILQQLQSVFDQVTLCIPVPKYANMIILATHSRSNLRDLLHSSTTLHTVIWDPTFGTMAQLRD